MVKLVTKLTSGLGLAMLALLVIPASLFAQDPRCPNGLADVGQPCDYDECNTGTCVDWTVLGMGVVCYNDGQPANYKPNNTPCNGGQC